MRHHIEVQCHACGDTTKVSYERRDELPRLLGDRGWEIRFGAISCRAHAHVRVLPRHTTLAKARARAVAS